MLASVTRCRALLFALACAMSACSGSQGAGADQPDGCYETCLDTCGRETRDPDGPTCAQECSAVCEGRRVPGTGAGDGEGQAESTRDAGSAGAIFTVTDP